MDLEIFAFFTVFFFIPVGFVLFVMWWAGAKRRQRLENARRTYKEWLSRLAEQPKNPDVRVGTLNAGRYLAKLEREMAGQNPSPNLFDETALMNDMNAYGGGEAR